MNRLHVNGGAVILAVGLMLSSSGLATAGIAVSVGYADDIRPSPFFPSPWEGSPGIIFAGAKDGGGHYDSGAIMVVNTGATDITITSIYVDGFGDGTSFNIWGGYIGAGLTLHAFGTSGDTAIFAQTSGDNFDSSDYSGSNPYAIPVVHITIDGITSHLSDTAQVLNTEGSDHLAANGLNESHAWREIGTFGGQAGNPVPEPSTLLSGLFALAIGSAYARCRRSRLA